MAVNLFLTTALLSITGSAAYVLLKLLLVASGNRLSQNWRYHSIIAISLLFVLPLYKLWALVPVPHPSLPPIIVASGNVDLIYIPSASATIGELPAQTGLINGGVDWGLVVECAAALWLLVAISLILRNIWRLLHYRCLFEQASHDVNSHLQQIALEAARLVGVTGEVRLLASPLVQSPMLVGFFRPTILLPSEHLPDSDARFILAHELTHFRRGDLWKKFLMNMIQCIHWFNPVVYLLSRDFAYWLETSCDEEVVSSLDYAQRKEYGYLLINYAPATRRVGPRLYVSFTSCRYKLKRRISIMMNSNKKSRSLLGLLLALALVVGCLATSALAANISDNGTTDDFALSFVTGQNISIKDAQNAGTGMVSVVDDAPAMVNDSVLQLEDLAHDELDMSSVQYFVSSATPFAFGSISTSVPGNKSAVAEDSFSLEAGETVTINCSYSPASASVDFGLIAPDGYFYYVNSMNGSINSTLAVTVHGQYTLAVRNNSSNTISVVGYVNY